MIHHFYCNVTKGGNFLRSFEQSNLVNNVRFSPTNSNKGKVQHLHVQILGMTYFDNPIY